MLYMGLDYIYIFFSALSPTNWLKNLISLKILGKLPIKIYFEKVALHQCVLFSQNFCHLLSKYYSLWQKFTGYYDSVNKDCNQWNWLKKNKKSISLRYACTTQVYDGSNYFIFKEDKYVLYFSQKKKQR